MKIKKKKEMTQLELSLRCSYSFFMFSKICQTRYNIFDGVLGRIKCKNSPFDFSVINSPSCYHSAAYTENKT